MSRRTWLPLGTLGLLAFVVAGMVYAQDYAIDWSTIDGGGAGVDGASAGGTYTLSSTIGQADA